MENEKNNWLESLQNSNQLAKVVDMNQYTERFGLALTEEEAKLIIQKRNDPLKEQRRIEFSDSITPKIIREFCDSDYIDQNNYVETIIRLQEIFYLFKNEMNDEITDDELLHLMKEQYEQLCFGDLDYLENTCLSDFAAAIRAGYSGYQETDGYGEYSRFDNQVRWDYELYKETLQELFWQ